MVKQFLPIILLNFVNVIGFSLLIPVLPVVSERYAPDLSEAMYGILLSSYALFQFLAAPYLGSLSDKYGRKPLLMISQLGTAISWVIFATAYVVPNIFIGPFALPLFIIALSRVTDGLTGGNISVAQAWLSDVTKSEDRTKAFGIIGAVFGMGFLIGPAIGGISSSTSLGYLGTCIVAFIISLVTLITMQLFLPESLPEEKRDKELKFHLWNELNIFNKIKIFSHNPKMFDLLRIRFAFAIVMGGFITVIILYIRDTFNLTPSELGLTLSAMGIFSIINQLFIVNNIAKKIGNLKTMYVGLGFMVINFLLISIIPVNFFLFLVTAYMSNLGISFNMPTFKSILAYNALETQQGISMGIDESLFALGNAISPVFAGILFSVIGKYTFLLLACLLLLPHLYVFITTKKLMVKI